MCLFSSPAKPSRARTSVASRRSSGDIRGHRRFFERVITITSRTVTGKFQSTLSTCGTYAMRTPSGTVTVPCTGVTAPTMDFSNVDLPDPLGPTMPTKSPLCTVTSMSWMTTFAS